MDSREGVTLDAPVDIHGMGDGELLPSAVTAPSASSLFAHSRRATCFDVFASLWVFMYERAVPHAQQEAQQNYLLDELQASTARLKMRRQDIHARLRQHVIEARRLQSRRDVRGFKNRMLGVRRLKLQVERIDTSIITIETNIEEIINSDVTKDIIDSLRRSTQAMRNQGMPLGGIEGVQETMDDLQTEIMSAQEVTDAVHKGINIDATGDIITEEDLVNELNLLLRDEGEEEIPIISNDGDSRLLSADPRRDDVGLTWRAGPGPILGDPSEVSDRRSQMATG
jgi:hypothetical protein